MTEFNQKVYEASLDVLLTANVSKDVTEAASKVVASDDATQPSLGRTPQDQEVVNEALNQYWQGQTDGE